MPLNQLEKMILSSPPTLFSNDLSPLQKDKPRDATKSIFRLTLLILIRIHSHNLHGS